MTEAWRCAPPIAPPGVRSRRRRAHRPTWSAARLLHDFAADPVDVAIAATGATVAPRRRLQWSLLALSLVLNLCFIGRTLWLRLHKPVWRMTPTERLERMSAELHLDAADQETFRHYFHDLSDHRQLMRQEAQPLVAHAWAEIAKPQPAEAKIAKLFDQAAETRRKYQGQSTSRTRAFLVTLAPEQRARFAQLVQAAAAVMGKPIHPSVPPSGLAASR